MLLIVAIGLPGAAQADERQDDPDDVYFEINGLVYMRSFTKDKGVGSKETEKLADMGLRFYVVGPVFADPELVAKDPSATPTKTYYVVKFYDIREDPPTTDKKVLGLSVTSLDNGRYFAISKDTFDTFVAQGYIRKLHRRGIYAPALAYGATLSVPFKFRPRIPGHNRDIVTDVTLAGYLGIRFRMTADRDYFVSLVGNAGLALVPINSGVASAPEAMQGTSTVPAITIAAGLVFQLNSFQLGLLTGRDYASGDLGNSWIYNTRQWYSFSLGYSFLGGAETKK
jgi:hypothetical protein